MKADLLIEIGTEDLPARYVRPLASQLSLNIPVLLNMDKIRHGPARYFATPRRIAVLIEDVASKQEDQKIQRKGPSLAQAFDSEKIPTAAAKAFARSCGVGIEQLGVLNTDKGSWMVFEEFKRGQPTTSRIQVIFDSALKGLSIERSMRWGSDEETFVRPVQWLVCMLGGKVVPLKRFGLTAGNKTYGHRFHSPKAIALKSPAEYEKKLKAVKVWVDFESRKAEIWKQIEAEARKLKGVPHKNDDLLNEVTALVEWPVTIHGRMEERFLQLPAEVVIATIEHNQRYFPVFGKNGKLLPYFIAVSNIKSKEIKQVIAGNERVVTPRLSDALFFWEQDLKQPFEAYGSKLDGVIFQKDLGSVADKVVRIKQLAMEISKQIPSPPAGEGQGEGLGGALTPPLNPLPQGEGRLISLVERAATLCKNDLVTRMVYEFPELQGVVGGYYAEKSGEAFTVVQAIREHYLPTQQGTPIPSTREGQIVALADKLDTLAGIFAIGQKPTASKDPFGLRRAALGVLRICIEGKLMLNLRAMLETALEIQPSGKRDADALNELVEFVMERLKGYYENLPIEMFEAVNALKVEAPLDFHHRLQAVQAFWELPEAKALAAAHKRTRNILKQASKEPIVEVQPDLLREKAEKELSLAIEAVNDYRREGWGGTFFGGGDIQALVAESEKKIDIRLTSAETYVKVLYRLAELKEPVDTFFDKVMVMAEDVELRANRLALLRNLDKLCRSIADISCLPG